MMIGQFQVPAGKNAYDADSIIPSLEEYLTSLSAEQYDRDASLHLLRLYQSVVELQERQLAIVRQSLVKALVRLPESDFLYHMYLIQQEQMLKDSVIALLKEFHSLLDSARFAQFWQKLEQSRSVVDALLNASVIDFDDSIRQFIAGVLEITFQSVQESVVLQCLHLTSLSDDIMQRFELTRTDNGSIKFATNTFNDLQGRARATQQSIKFEQVAGIINSVLQG